MATKNQSITLAPVNGDGKGGHKWQVLITKNILEWYPGQIISQAEYGQIVEMASIDVHTKELKAS